MAQEIIHDRRAGRAQRPSFGLRDKTYDDNASIQITPDQDAIVTEIEIAAPPERVFQALTDPAQLMLWWAATPKGALWEMDARLGGKWRYELTDPSRKIVVNGVRDFKAHGEITEFDPPRVLAYTWLGNWHEHPEQPSTARWELSPPGRARE